MFFNFAVFGVIIGTRLTTVLLCSAFATANFENVLVIRVVDS